MLERDDTPKRRVGMNLKRWSPQLLAVAASILTVGLLTGVAVANSSGASYTGCLSYRGIVTQVALGDHPSKPCTRRSTQVSWGRGPGQEQFDKLRADLDAILKVISIDPITGAVTVASEGDLILESGDTDEVMIMDDTMVEGDTTLMEDATVTGETILEGDTTLMEDAAFMGDVTFEGGLMLSDTAVTVVDGVLTPTSSSVTITMFTGQEPLREIPAAASSGMMLEIHFGVSSDEIGVFGNGFVEPSNSGPGNINLTQQPGDPFLFDRGDTLRLVSRGTFWDEVSRSSRHISGHIEAFTLERRIDGFSGEVNTEARCTDPIDEFGDPDTARVGSVLLSSGVSVLSGNVEILSHTTEVDFEGTEVVRITLLSDGIDPFSSEVLLVLRCLSI